MVARRALKATWSGLAIVALVLSGLGIGAAGALAAPPSPDATQLEAPAPADAHVQAPQLAADPAAAPVDDDAVPPSDAPEHGPTDVLSQPAEAPEAPANATSAAEAELSGPEIQTGDGDLNGEDAAARVAEAETQDATSTLAEVTGGSLSWGFMERWRSYVTGKIAVGEITAVAPATLATDSKITTWQNATGQVDLQAGAGTITYAGGMLSQGHKLKGSQAYQLNQVLANPQIVLSSQTSATLSMEVTQEEYAAFPGHTGERIVIADLTFAAGDLVDGQVTAKAKMTPTGAAVYGVDSNYAAGVDLDSLQFGINAAAPEPEPEDAKPTATVLAAPPTVVEGTEIPLSATVTPQAPGAIQFSVNGKPQGKPVQLAEGHASLNVKLGVGAHQLGAAFIPADATKFLPSAAESRQLQVTKRPTTPGGDDVRVTSGSLTWGVKDTWRNYVTGGIAKGRVLAKAPATLANGLVTWNDGASSGTVNLTRGTGSITYQGTMRSEGHRGAGEDGGFGLDQELQAPRITLTSPQTATLSAVVSQSSYAAFPAHDRDRIDLANLTFSAQELARGVVTASATLTASGAQLFGATGNYLPGSYADNVTFSVNAAAAKATSLTLTASARSVIEGSDVSVTAAVTPGTVPGTVTFFQDGAQIDKRAAKSGSAATTIRQLPVGEHRVTARFQPKSANYAPSVASAVVTVQAIPPVPAATDGPREGALTWGVSSAMANYTTGPIAKGAVVTSGVGSSGAGYVFPQASAGAWDAATQTGTVQYTGSVTFTGHKGLLSVGVSDPVITVSGGAAATISGGGNTWPLDLASATKTIGTDGSVTWSGVPVNGSFTGGSGGGSQYSLGIDPLTFTVGAPSSVGYGSTTTEDEKPKRTAADTAPALTGVTVLTEAKKIRPGGRIEITANGFDAKDEGVLVVLYAAGQAGPMVLDEEAKADERGVVSWSGTLPKETKGKHVITLQGSIDAGAPIDIRVPKAAKNAPAQEAELEIMNAPVAAAIGAAPASASSEWQWWASAGGLVVIASCMSLLVMRQRRLGLTV